MYRCVCDWLGLPYRDEVQWVSIPHILLSVYMFLCVPVLLTRYHRTVIRIFNQKYNLSRI